MKLINEKLAVAEYKYPYYEKINPILFSYIMGVPNDPQHPNNVRAKMTSRNLENKELVSKGEMIKKLKECVNSKKDKALKIKH